MQYDGKECEILNRRVLEDGVYYDILLPERNVNLSSLRPIEEELKENTYAIYIKDNFMELVYIEKIDLTYSYAYIKIYKSNIPSYFLVEINKQ
jgi:hypothetical protein